MLIERQDIPGCLWYDATSIDFNNAFGMGMAPEAYILYDFDSGLL